MFEKIKRKQDELFKNVKIKKSTHSKLNKLRGNIPFYKFHEDIIKMGIDAFKVQ